jgi:hypothetical protein
MAACTRSGARKASEIVMLTFRMLHRSHLAMLPAFAFASARSSSSADWRSAFGGEPENICACAIWSACSADGASFRQCYTWRAGYEGTNGEACGLRLWRGQGMIRPCKIMDTSCPAR